MLPPCCSGLVWILFSGAHGADLGALLGLNPPSPPQNLATSPPAENLLGATCVSLVFPLLLTTKMGRGMSFPHTRTSGNVLLRLGCKKWGQLVGKISFSQSCFADLHTMPVRQHQRSMGDLPREAFCEAGSGSHKRGLPPCLLGCPVCWQRCHPGCPNSLSCALTATPSFSCRLKPDTTRLVPFPHFQGCLVRTCDL